MSSHGSVFIEVSRGVFAFAKFPLQFRHRTIRNLRACSDYPKLGP